MMWKRLLLIAVFLISATGLAANISAEEISLLSNDTQQWISEEVLSGSKLSKATVTISGELFQFNNTAGLWPDIKRNLNPMFEFNVQTDRISYEFKPGKTTGIWLTILDGAGAERILCINPAVSGAKISVPSGEITASAGFYKGEMTLGELNTDKYNGSGYSGELVKNLADENGMIKITTVKIFVVGNGAGTVDFRKLSIVIPDGTTESSVTTAGKTDAQKSTAEASTGTGGSKKKTNEATQQIINTTVTTLPGKSFKTEQDKAADVTNIADIAAVETSTVNSAERTAESRQAFSDKKHDSPVLGDQSNPVIPYVMIISGLGLLLAAVFFIKKPKNKSGGNV